MKANEAPEKIYISNFDIEALPKNEQLSERWHEVRTEDTDIEYTRTDAFIMNYEKALSWLKNHYKDYMYNPTGERLEAFFGGDMCNDFEDYIKEEL